MAPNYGRPHKRLRRAWASKVAAGTVHCRRCGKLIAPGAPWDLGHDDLRPLAPPRPEHRGCNRATLTHARERAGTHLPDPGLKASRDW